MSKIGVTLARNLRGNSYVAQAKQWATQLDALYVERPQNDTLENFVNEFGFNAIVVVEKAGPRIYMAEDLANGDTQGFTYHQGMTLLRLINMRRGLPVHLREALNLSPGKHVLDCTMGLAADTAIASVLIGETGVIVGVEASPLVHLAVSYGLKTHDTGDAELNAAMRRIQTVCSEATDYLEQCIANHTRFDVVYFDPMFRRPVKGSVAMEALRTVAYTQPLSQKAVLLAKQVSDRVVIKERNRYILEGYGCHEFIGGKYSRFVYGIIDVKTNINKG